VRRSLVALPATRRHLLFTRRLAAAAATSCPGLKASFPPTALSPPFKPHVVLRSVDRGLEFKTFPFEHMPPHFTANSNPLNLYSQCRREDLVRVVDWTAEAAVAEYTMLEAATHTHTHSRCRTVPGTAQSELKRR